MSAPWPPQPPPQQGGWPGAGQVPPQRVPVRPPMAPPSGPQVRPPMPPWGVLPPGYGWRPPPPPPKPQPSKQTTRLALIWLLVSTALLLGSLVLPMFVPEGSHWLTGPTLAQYGPQLLGGEPDGYNIYFVTMMMLTATTALGMLLGAARMLNFGLAIVLSVLACLGLALSLFLSLILLAGASIANAAPGLAAYALPVGYLGVMLAVYIPRIRNGWIRPPKQPTA